jgi:hypothetical protein
MANLILGLPKKAKSIGLIILGSMFCIGGLWSFIDTQDFVSQAIQTEGTIIQFIKETRINGQIYKPVFSFSDNSGINHQVKGIIASSPPIGKIGDKIVILYKSSDPNNARINDVFFLYLFPIISSSIGFIILMVGYFQFRKSKVPNI